MKEAEQQLKRENYLFIYSIKLDWSEKHNMLIHLWWNEISFRFLKCKDDDHLVNVIHNYN